MSGGRAGLNHHLVNMVMCSVNCLDELPRELQQMSIIVLWNAEDPYA